VKAAWDQARDIHSTCAMNEEDSIPDLTSTDTVLIDIITMGFQLAFHKEDLELSIKTHCIIYHLQFIACPVSLNKAVFEKNRIILVHSFHWENII